MGNRGEMGKSCGKRVAFSMVFAHVAKHRPNCPSAEEWSDTDKSYLILVKKEIVISSYKSLHIADAFSSVVWTTYSVVRFANNCG